MRILLSIGLFVSFAALATAQTPAPDAPRFINPEGLAKPGGYTHVVVTTGGRTIYVAGQVARDRDGNVVGKGDLRAQARQVFDNLATALKAAGASLTDVVKMTTYVTTMELDAFREVRAEKLGGHAPANTLVQVVALADPAFLIEIEVVAVVAGK